ncbi:MAG: response regulator [bacterium]|nr:response regulator [bacterium]
MLDIFLVDDDSEAIALQTAWLERAGHRVRVSSPGVPAIEAIRDRLPDCVIFDLTMSGIDGFDLCRRLRADPALRYCKLVVASSTTHAPDRRRAKELGADGYIVKPVAPVRFVQQVERIVSDHAAIKFWGVRGSLPVPGKHTVRYGGNTTCVTLELNGDQFFIFDAGSGIKTLSNELMRKADRPCEAKIFISHPHADHINALPFFAPLYESNNRFEIFGAANGRSGVRELLGAQMNGVYHPLTLHDLGASVSFHDLQEGCVQVDGVEVRTMLLNHPGNCLGFRVEHRECSICYVTDNELFPSDLPQHDAAYADRLLRFVEGSHVLITDCTYTDEEYVTKVGWGHSCSREVAELAHRAAVDALYLIHHDPDQTDDDVERKLMQVRAHLAALGSRTVCHAPAEGETVRI